MTLSVANIQQTDSNEMWAMAMQWVSENRKLIRQIASPYIRHMAADSNDLFQEAAIAAYKALISSQKKEKPNQFVPFFRVIFKTNCIRLASGIQTVQSLEDYQLPCPEKPEESDELETGRIEEALQAVSKRQREICIWLLQQPEPVSTPDLARKFKVSRRHACRLISSSIERISGTVR
ncbi:MAG: sigma-70 family RNA polymerase sigma factor [Proteobacteria bacterium]|nr:sigma-70 family RNA polymerase sigma factor [Pseudomonadota bacterium]MBU0967592.1 sigma-70 family RNA polymerase sigma factor [Pseudomonadota bacterium]